MDIVFVGGFLGWLIGCVVVGWAWASRGLGFGTGFVLSLLLSPVLGLVIGRTDLDLELAITPGSLAKIGAFAAAIAGLAAILPIRQVAGIDPAVVFRRGASA